MEKRILAVDDDNVMLGFVRDTLTGAGYSVACASSGREAMELLAREKYDCIVLDFYMPEKDGLDVVGREVADVYVTVQAFVIPVFNIKIDTECNVLDSLVRQGV